MLGDSTAQQQIPALGRALANKVYDLQWFTPFFYEWSRSTLAIISKLQQVLKPRDVVVVSFYVGIFQSEERKIAVTELMLRTSDLMASTGATMVILDATHHLYNDLFPPGAGIAGWMLRPRWFAPVVERVFYKPRSIVDAENAYFQHLMANCSKRSNVHFIPLRHLFCSGDMCLPHIPGTKTVAHFDGHHLTQAASLYLWPFVCSDLRSKGVVLSGLQ
jgi:hypothetical protein